MKKPVVMFLCTGNSARSQMAEALLRDRAGDRFEALSAGLDPKGVHPMTHAALSELGIDTSGLRSKHVSEYLGRVSADYAVVVCEQAQQRCPAIVPFALRTLYWPFDDPAAHPGPEPAKMECFRRIRDEIEQRIRTWLEGNASSEA